MLLFGQVNINICSIIKHTHMSQELYMVALDNDASCVEVYFCQGIFFYIFIYIIYIIYIEVYFEITSKSKALLEERKNLTNAKPASL